MSGIATGADRNERSQRAAVAQLIEAFEILIVRVNNAAAFNRLSCLFQQLVDEAPSERIIDVNCGAHVGITMIILCKSMLSQ